MKREENREDSKNLIKTSLVIVITSLIIVYLLTNSAFASTSLVTYGDALPNNSTVQNLIRNASNYDTFYNSDYVIFRAGQYDYYIFWGNDISVYDNKFGGSDLEYMRYYRTSSTDDYKWIHGSTDSLSVNKTFEVTSNVNGLGLKSELAESFIVYYYKLIAYSFVVGISAFIAFKIGGRQI